MSALPCFSPAPSPCLLPPPDARAQPRTLAHRSCGTLARAQAIPFDGVWWTPTSDAPPGLPAPSTCLLENVQLEGMSLTRFWTAMWGNDTSSSFLERVRMSIPIKSRASAPPFFHPLALFQPPAAPSFRSLTSLRGGLSAPRAHDRAADTRLAGGQGPRAFTLEGGSRGRLPNEIGGVHRKRQGRARPLGDALQAAAALLAARARDAGRCHQPGAAARTLLWRPAPQCAA